jgi:hypothetical protein
MSCRTAILAGLGGMAFSLAFGMAANAAVISDTYNQALTATPVTVSFDGVGGFQFTTVVTGYGPGAWVNTSGGAAQVTTIAGSVTDFYSGSTIDQTGELYNLSSVSTPQMIQYSAADDFIGLAVTLNDGVHYGYAEVDGPDLVSVGFESSADTTILTGATGTGTGIALNTGGPVATPEPASLALLLGGVGMVLVGRRRWSGRAA